MPDIAKHDGGNAPDPAQETGKMEFADMLKVAEQEIPWRIVLKEESRTVFRSVDRRYYERLSAAACKMEVRRLFKYASPTTIANLVNALCEQEDRLFDDALFRQSRERVIGFENAVFDLRSGKVRAYMPTDFIMDPLPFKLPKTVNPEAETWFIEILTSWVGAETADWLLNLIAYLMFIYPNDEQIWCNFFGMGSNGKSVLLGLMEAILGDGKAIGVDLQHINRFTNQACKDKWLILGRDSSSFVSDAATAFIKNYSGDAKSMVEEKGGSSYDVYNAGKLLVSTNTLIQSRDRTYSWYRRLLPIPFPNIFPRNEAFKRKLFQRLPEIVRLLLDRAYRYKTNQVSIMDCIPTPVEDLRRETRHLNDRVSAFWELHFFEQVKTGHNGNSETKTMLDVRKVCNEFHKMTMFEVYNRFKAWHHDEFGEDEPVQPAMNTFCGPYGAFLQTDAGKVFEYKRDKHTRYISVKEQVLEKLCDLDATDYIEPEKVF